MPRDLPPRTGPGRIIDPSGARSRGEAHEVREETEPLELPSDWDVGAGADDGIDELPDDEPAALPPLSAAPMGTHDRPPTRVESPAARRPPSGGGGPRTPAAPPAAAPERPEDRIGTSLGAYRLHALIGKGGMGFVYRAEHARLGREVALKLLRADYARRRDSVARFFQEARTVNRIRHRNIVDVTDFVELDDGTTYIIMELLRGQSLGSWARHGFDPARALGILLQICDGLAAAHAVGVIHRDLKPDNVVVMPTGDGTELVKLLDFGVAKLLNRDDEDVGLETAAGSVIGTPAYMSPEQAGGLPIDARADIYSLGAIMYELFCGQPLFRGRSFGEYVRKHLNELPVPPRETARGAAIDPRLERIILHSLEKDPARRYQTIDRLRHDLLELLAGLGRVEAPGPFHRSTRLDAAAPLPGPGAMTPPPHPPLAMTPPPHASSAPPGYHPTPYPDLGGSLGDSLVRIEPGLAPRSRRALWFAAIATVGAGAIVAIALVAAARNRVEPAPTAAAPPAPTPAPAAPEISAGSSAAAPVVSPPPAPAPDMIAVRIEAPSGARVLHAGDEVELCVAPCLLSLAPPDVGAPTRRDYLVRLAGHPDRTITIDLAAPPPVIAVQFDAAAPPAAAADGRRRPGRPTAPEADTATRVEPGRPPAGTATPTADPPATTTPPPTTTPPKKRPTIDPTDTIDPFATEK